MTRLTRGNRSVAGRVAVVTGAGSGIGRATAHLFGDEGAAVACIDLDQGAVDAVVAELTGAGYPAMGRAIDVSDAAAVATVIDDVVATLGPPDILVNNAGISIPAPIDDDGFGAAWERTIAVNLTAHTTTIRACLAHLERNGEGRIVNISSTEGIGGSAYMVPYTTSKHGVAGLTKALAIELGERGVTVNAIGPGPIHTGMTSPIDDAAKTKFARRRVPLRRYGDPEEIAQMILSLCLPAASYVTGHLLMVDGGMTIKNN